MQLKTQWIHKDQIAILKGNKVVAAPKVRYFTDRSRFLQTRGNHKTKDVYGMINNVANGCFRLATGFDKCDQPCYDGNCYANHSVFALKRRREFNIISNGIHNDLFHINLPAKENFSYKLNTLKLWRIGSESSDMSLALALDIVEPWVMNNPDKFFTGISSDYFFVSADRLKKLAQYDNFLVGHTISVWFGDDDLDNRFEQIERFQDYGIKTSVWVTTNNDWLETKKQQKRQDRMIKRMLKLVSPQQVIEVPYHFRKNYEDAMLYINPDGYCCETHKCKGCKVLCGYKYALQEKRKINE